ncbi:dihydropteroate synthase [Halorubellus sp. JP-L1]|uniref:dihydropteroate synthase n=1 Tax=Halorubellus sp. JP-L1 TaxID=2715753 RepID=UPI00140A5C30|nr:dihydropteroate synthase [Halorubellus sp. JP-L1]NHN42614.1 dihydropteroate synthase [Halorubellus sp. JP-L1]
MQYHEAANFLFDLRRYRPSPGTASTARLLDSLGNPHEGVDFVQVAGSNGKGSTARMVESVLRETDRTVGLFTSPHLEDVRERVRVDGRKVTREAVCEFVEASRSHVRERAADGESPTFFEAMTALALWYFGERDVDVAVLEVGIGGKFDATSVVDPVASAVTSVTLEHTGVLGDTIAEIATDKAHVAPTDAPVVTGATGEALAAVREQAGDVLTVGSAADAGNTGDDAATDDDPATDDDASPDVRVTYGGRTNHAEAAVGIETDDAGRLDARIPLLGEYQAVNAGIAATLARQVAGVDDETLARGLRSAHWPGRFEVVSQEPLAVLDGAHNPGACEGLASTLSTFEYDDLHLVVGAMHDKDHRGMAAALPAPDACYACEPDLARSEDADVLARVFGANAETASSWTSVASAVDAALDAADASDCVLVTGSLFAVAEARERWTRLEVPRTVRDLEDATARLEGANVADQDVHRLRTAGVHRVLTTRVQDRQARRLEATMAAAGGQCAVSGVDGNDERKDVVLMGTLAQFDELVATLADEPYGLDQFAEEVGDALDLAATDEDGRTAASPNATDDRWPWESGTAVMGILNVTPNSFFDGGEYEHVADAVSRAEEMVANGADVVDVGGESTRPGADPVSVADEIDRVVPVVEGIREAGLDVTISVDTRKAAVADAALDAGADVVNDVSGLDDPEMRFVAAEHDAGLCVMHSIDTPVDPENAVAYDDVVDDVLDQLREHVLLAEKAGVDRRDVLVDPGLGFGKTAAESFELLDRVDEFAALDCPVLVGHSHKSMFAAIGRESDERLSATVAGTALAADRGADVVRVHDVDENVAAVDAARAARDPETLDGRDEEDD